MISGYDQLKYVCSFVYLTLMVSTKYREIHWWAQPRQSSAMCQTLKATQDSSKVNISLSQLCVCLFSKIDFGCLKNLPFHSLCIPFLQNEFTSLLQRTRACNQCPAALGNLESDREVLGSFKDKPAFLSLKTNRPLPSTPFSLPRAVGDQQRPEVTGGKTGVFRRAQCCPDGRRD